MTKPSAAEDSPPSRTRARTIAVWAATAALLVGAFFIPQEVPLEWYPLNNPGTDINYLELKCAANKDGWVQIYYDITHGYNDLDSIRFPISPTEQTYTYTFPLVDAPMIRLRLDPVENGGSLKIHHLRIINRREEEIRRFPSWSLVPLHEIAGITEASEDWVVTSTADAKDPYAEFEPFPAIVPVGMNVRNLKRCLLSTGYLTIMLWILMMAVVTAFWKPSSWKDFLGKVGIIALLAVPLAMIGNRGLIRNSIHYARYVPPVVHERFHLEFDLSSTRPQVAQIYWDTGMGQREPDSVRAGYAQRTDPQTIRFALPELPLRGLRFDPQDAESLVRITRIRVTNPSYQTIGEIPLDSLQPRQGVLPPRMENGALVVETTPGASDPIMEFTPAAVDAINQAVTSAKATATPQETGQP